MRIFLNETDKDSFKLYEIVNHYSLNSKKRIILFIHENLGKVIDFFVCILINNGCHSFMSKSSKIVFFFLSFSGLHHTLKYLFVFASNITTFFTTGNGTQFFSPLKYVKCCFNIVRDKNRLFHV